MSIQTKFLGYEIKNPLMPAAGPPVRDAKACIDCIKGGCGVMVTKTISNKAAQVPTPNMMNDRIHKYFLNTELWSELSPEQWIKYEYPKIKEACKESKIPMICSLGYTAEEISEIVPKISEFADGIELSTHYIGDDPKPMQEAIKAAIKGSNGKPVFVKLSPSTDVVKAAKIAKESGASGLVCINSFGPCLSLDIKRKGAPFMGSDSKYGWISGPPLKPISLRVVHDIAKEIDLPIIGVGGISNGTDVIEYLMAGASYVGICTSAIIKGRNIFNIIENEMKNWMKSHNYKDLNELIGLGIKHKQFIMKNPPIINKNKCVGCGACVKSCCYDAIKIGKDGIANCNNDLCFKCGLCYSRCPVNAISIE